MKNFSIFIMTLTLLAFSIFQESLAQTSFNFPTYYRISPSLTAAFTSFFEKRRVRSCADYYHTAAYAFDLGADGPRPATCNVDTCPHLIDDILYYCRYTESSILSTLRASLNTCTKNLAYTSPYTGNNSTCRNPISRNGTTGAQLQVFLVGTNRTGDWLTLFPDTTRDVICVNSSIYDSIEDNFSQNTLFSYEEACLAASR